MKKIIGLAVAALLSDVTAANAVPTLKMTLTQASATIGQCTSGGGTWLGGGSCEFISTTGLVAFTGSFGGFQLNQ